MTLLLSQSASNIGAQGESARVVNARARGERAREIERARGNWTVCGTASLFSLLMHRDQISHKVLSSPNRDERAAAAAADKISFFPFPFPPHPHPLERECVILVARDVVHGDSQSQCNIPS